MKKISETQLRFLELVGTFGYLTSRELAELCWPNMSPRSAIVTAQTAGKKLSSLGLVFSRQLPVDNLSRCYVLTTRGADVLNDHYCGRWVELDEATPQAWFTDGYNLSLMHQFTRRPVTLLAHQMAAALGLRAIGQRGLVRGFLGLRAYAEFEAVLVDASDQVVLAIYQAHPSTAAATPHVVRLARQSVPFLVASAQPLQLQALRKWRDATSPLMALYVNGKLPAGVLA